MEVQEPCDRPHSAGGSKSSSGGESDDSSEEYKSEARDAFAALYSFQQRSRSNSLRRIRNPEEDVGLQRHRVGQSSLIISSNGQSHDQDDGPATLDDLPTLEIEDAPPGWGNRRRRGTVAAPDEGTQRRASMMPGTGGRNSLLPRRSVSERGSRRASQMTFNEWCQLKRFQEIHNAAIKAQNVGDKSDSHPLIRKNISYEEWLNTTEERKKKELKELIRSKVKEEEEKELRDQAKYKRRMSYDKWKEMKHVAKAAAAKVADAATEGTGSRHNSLTTCGRSNSLSRTNLDATDEALSSEEKKKKAEEAHRKWVIKKDLEEIKKERDMLLRMQNASLTISPPTASSPALDKKRRGSWMDAQAAIQVAANRGNMKS